MTCLPRSSVKFKVCMVLFPCVFVIQVIAVSTDFWVTSTIRGLAGNRGLFKDCLEESGNAWHATNGFYYCIKMENPPSWLVAVQAMEIIGIVALALIGISSLCCAGLSEIPSPCRKFGILWTLITGLFILTGIVIFVKHKPSNANLHYSFGLCIGSFIGTIVCAVLLIFDFKCYVRQKADDANAGQQDSGELSGLATESRTPVPIVETREPYSAAYAEDVPEEVTSVHPVPSAPPEPEPWTSGQPPTYSSVPTAPPPSYAMLKAQGLI